MRSTINVGITGIGIYVPEKTYDNAFFESYLDTSDEWITQRTGVKVRHIAEKGTPNSDLAYRAAIKALAMSNTKPEEIDLIIVCTVTPDMLFPSTACILQAKLGAINAGAHDVLAACSSFIYGLSIAHGQIALGHVKKVLLVGSEVMSSIIDYNDRGVCVLFGDGAGAVLIEETPIGRGQMIDYILKADGSHGNILYMPGGGSANPPTHDTINRKMHYIHMEGREVFKHAVRHMSELARKILDRNGLTFNDVDLICIHQANLRIVSAVMNSLGLDMETKSYNNIDRYGNTTAASIPLCLYDAMMEGRLSKSNKVLLLSLGAGLTYAAALMEWGLDKTEVDFAGAAREESAKHGREIVMQVRDKKQDEIQAQA